MRFIAGPCFCWLWGSHFWPCSDDVTRQEDQIRDHGGDIDTAQARFGGTDWIDLSTGINRAPYPLQPLPPEVWTALPTQAATARLLTAAGAAYRSQAPILAVAGAQAAIQLIPKLSTPARARILTPTYNEHGAALRSAGWKVDEVTTLAALEGADLAVVVNPNNPDGRSHAPEDLLRLATRVGRLVVDESFADARPDLSLASKAGQERLIVLRSFGKFFGLAGLRLGFAIADGAILEKFKEWLGPWAVSGPALSIAASLLSSDQTSIFHRIRERRRALGVVLASSGLKVAGGTDLFALVADHRASDIYTHLAMHHILVRKFDYAGDWLRFGLAPDEEADQRLARALAEFG